MNVKVKKKERANTKTIWYAIVEKMEVPIDFTDEQIDEVLMLKATDNGTLDEGKDYIWSEKDNIVDYN